MNDIIIGVKDNFNILDVLFEIRSSTLEQVTEEEKKYIKENKLRQIKHDDVNQYIRNLDIAEEKKQKIIKDFEQVLNDEYSICYYKFKQCYEAGINDAVNILFNNRK